MAPKVDPIHLKNCEIAKERYIASRNARSGLNDWHTKLRDARRMIAKALRASDYLRDIAGALAVNAGHMRTFRHLMAPPISQDQFILLCSDWSKGAENGGKAISASRATAASAIVHEWIDPGICGWLSSGRKPTLAEIRVVFLRTAPLIAHQDLATWKRNQIANQQEQEVIKLLDSKGWTKLPSKLIDKRATIPPRHFMHKTRFATNTTTPQEVDIACGLKDTYVAAMECKVTNDTTNSVKRVNDVVKKASAWKEQWGRFVVTAALLQGVISPKDVQRLTDNDVLVFWSHDLATFGDWLDTMV